MPSETTIVVPDVLGGPPDRAETFLGLLAASQPGRKWALELARVNWVCPYGSVLLLGACRYLTQLSGHPVQVTSLQNDVHAYLRRVDFFERSGGTSFTADVFDEAHDWGRNPSSTSVLELVHVEQPDDVYQVTRRAREILRYWLAVTSQDIDRIVSLLAETCSNVVDHSRDSGVVTIQKYERGRYVNVELAISDLGIGIRRSLADVHGKVAETPSGYIERALGGLSARKGRGGQGLGAIQRIAVQSGGRLYIRSETGSVVSQPNGTVGQDGLAFFPGTQVAITFRSRQ